MYKILIIAIILFIFPVGSYAQGRYITHKYYKGVIETSIVNSTDSSDVKRKGLLMFTPDNKNAFVASCLRKINKTSIDTNKVNFNILSLNINLDAYCLLYKDNPLENNNRSRRVDEELTKVQETFKEIASTESQIEEMERLNQGSGINAGLTELFRGMQDDVKTLESLARDLRLPGMYQKMDINEAKARVYCLAFFGKESVPYLKYSLNRDRETVLESATCIKNDKKIGNPNTGSRLTCTKGIKEVNIAGGAYKCRACIEKFPEIKLGDGTQWEDIPGVQCTSLSNNLNLSRGPTSRPNNNPNNADLSYGPTSRPNNNSSNNTRVDSSADNGGQRQSVINGNAQQQSQSGGGTQQNSQQYYNNGSNSGTYRGQSIMPQRPPQQPTQQRQSIWDAIKQSLTGGGGNGGRPRSQQGQNSGKIMPECVTFLALDNEIDLGDSTTLQWALEYTSSAYITPGIGLVNPTQGSIKITPKETTTYTIQTHNRNGYGKCAPIRVIVKEPLDNPTDEPADEQPKDPLIKCSPQEVRPGNTGAVLWQCPSGTFGSVGGSTEYPDFTTQGKMAGSVEINNMQESGKFVVRCVNDLAEEVGRNSCNIDVTTSAANTDPIGIDTPRASIASDKTEVNYEEIVTIAWRGDNVDACQLIGPGNFKRYELRGSITARMRQTSTFTLSCIANNVILPTKEITITVI